jgi:hypothetical protein
MNFNAPGTADDPGCRSAAATPETTATMSKEIRYV